MTKGSTFILAFMGYLLVISAWRNLRDPVTREVLRTLSWRDFTWSFLSIAVVAAIGILVYELHPVFQWSWWQYFGGSGSIATGRTQEAGRALGPTILAVLFPLLLMVNVPAFAFIEEKMFRAGSERRTTVGNTLQSVVFGLVHMVMGIPFAGAIAISFAGWFFTKRYLNVYSSTNDVQVALMASTARHAAYNIVLMSILLLGGSVLLLGLLIGIGT